MCQEEIIIPNKARKSKSASNLDDIKKSEHCEMNNEEEIINESKNILTFKSSNLSDILTSSPLFSAGELSSSFDDCVSVSVNSKQTVNSPKNVQSLCTLFWLNNFFSL